MTGLRAWLAISAVAGVGALLAGCTSARPHRPDGSPSDSTVPAAVSSPPLSASAAPSSYGTQAFAPTGSPVPAPLMAGKFAANSIVYASPSTGLIGIAGYPDNSASPAGWLERSSDFGRRWTIGPATVGAAQAASQTGMAFTSAEDGWAYRPGLVFTTDAGLTWQPEPAAPALIGPLAVAGDSAWFAGYPCPRGTCRARLYRSDRVGAPPTLLRHQPPVTASIDELLRSDPRTALLLTSDRRGRQQLSGTVDGGRSWTTHRLPCASAEAAGGRAAISAAGPGAVWLLCPEVTPSCASSRYVHNVIYQSADHGASWTRTTPPQPTCQTPISVYAVGDTVAWATVSDQGVGSVLRTGDRGRTWHRVLAGSRNSFLGVEAVTTSGVRGFSFVRYGYRHGGDTFTVYRTADGGRTWQTTPLPVPADLAAK